MALKTTTPPDYAPRQALAEALKPNLPSTWKIVPYTDKIDVPTTTVLMLRLTALTRYQPAPQAGFTGEFEFILATPHTDPERAEDDLDQSFITLANLLNASRNVLWTRAEKGSVINSEALAYSFTVEVFIENTPAETKEN